MNGQSSKIFPMPTNLSQSRYNKRGVSSDKSEVHKVVDHMDRGLFPGAFCKVTEDLLTNNPEYCNVIHSDGAGTKSILGYLWYRETGDASVFRGIAQDSIVMNLDDLACVGIWDQVVLSSTVNRNARNFPGEALAALIEGTEAFLQTLADNGISIKSGGGETADVGDLTGTVAVDSCAVAVCPRDKVIDNARIGPGLSIVGLSSCGQASYETFENSGIGSNGLTSARHELLSSHYRENYPETFDPQTDPDYVYCGPHRMKDLLPGSTLSVGEALLSPTRTYLPVVKRIIEEVDRQVLGLVHCSGGGRPNACALAPGFITSKTTFSPYRPFSRKSSGPLKRARRKCTKFTTWVTVSKFSVCPRSHPRSSNCPENSTSKPKSLEEPKRPKRQTGPTILPSCGMV